MLNTRFGVEIEFTGITRKEAAQKAKKVLGGEVRYIGTYYDAWSVDAPDGRTWKFMSDASIMTQKKKDGTISNATKYYSVELVTPILTYTEDIETLQNVIRELRKAGGFVNNSCGIHIHLDGKDHSVQSIKNFISIIYARNDLFYSALKINSSRRRFCMKLDENLVWLEWLERPERLVRLDCLDRKLHSMQR